MKLSGITGLAVLLAMTAFGAAQAQDQDAAGGHGHMREACQADMAKLCPGVQPGGGRVMQCFKAHKDELSDGCRSALMEMRAAHQAAKADAAPH